MQRNIRHSSNVTQPRIGMFVAAFAAVAWALSVCSVAAVFAQTEQPAAPKNAEKEAPAQQTKQAKTVPARKWINLYNGQSLAGWNITKFGGEGEVYVKDGILYIEMGVDLSGITYRDVKKLPKTNYEIEVEAQRFDGNDFFCGLTFPVEKKPCSLILGGWGGGVCGLSSIDGMDASENETTLYREFKEKKWYNIRLRVTPKNISAWLDGDRIIDQNLEDREVSIRYEVELSRPLGIATWCTTGAYRKIRMRELTPEEIDSP